MSKRLYIKLAKEFCELDSNTGIWKFKLPDDFTYSRSPAKKITVNSFIYYGAFNPPSGAPQTCDYVSLHCPTLHDGNYNQEAYIATACYNYNSVYKTFPIKSQPQYLEFYFKDYVNGIIKQFYYEAGPTSDFADRDYEERFIIDLCLEY